VLIHRDDTIGTAVFFRVDTQRWHNWNGCVLSGRYTEKTQLERLCFFVLIHREDTIGTAVFFRVDTQRRHNWNGCVLSCWYTEKTQLKRLCSFRVDIKRRHNWNGGVHVDTQRRHNWNNHMARNNPNIKTAITVLAEAVFWFLRKINFQTWNIYSSRLSANVTEQYCFFDHRLCWQKENRYIIWSENSHCSWNFQAPLLFPTFLTWTSTNLNISGTQRKTQVSVTRYKHTATPAPATQKH
jgi:hypothetical protein